MKNKIFIVVNYFVSIILLYLLLKNTGIKSTVLTFSSANIWLISAAVVVSIFTRLFVYPLLWQEVFLSSKLNVSYSDLLAVNAVSLPLKFVMPFKISELIRSAGLKVFGQTSFAVTLSSTLFLRLSVTIAIFIIFIIGMILNPLVRHFPEWLVWSVLFIFLIIFFNIGRLPKNFLWLGESMNELVYCFRKTSDLQKIKLLGYSVVFQFGEIISSFLIFKSLGIPISFPQIIYYTSLAMLASALPISVQGIGVRETTFVFVLSGVAPLTLIFSAGMLLSLIHHIIPAFIGILLWIFSLPKRTFVLTVSNVKVYSLVISILLIFNPYIVYSADKAKIPKAEVETKIKNLSSKDRNVRMEAVRSLSTLKDMRVENAFIEQFKKEEDPYVKIQILEGLKVYKSTAAKELIIQALKDINPDVRQSAAVYLADFGFSEETFEILNQALENENVENVKLAIMNSIEKYIYKSTSSVSVLVKLLDSKESVNVRKYSAMILKNVPSAKEFLERYRNDPDIGEIIRE